jgi:hypothetical protein
VKLLLRKLASRPDSKLSQENQMPDEKTMRRSEFVPGVSILLADDHLWVFPSPDAKRFAQVQPLGAHSEQPDYQAIIRGMIEAEDISELLRAELAFAIYLLGQNYDLSPLAYQELFLFGSDDPRLETMRQSIRHLAQSHISVFYSVAGSTHVSSDSTDGRTQTSQSLPGPE